MKRRILAFACMLAVLIGLAPVSAIPKAKAETTTATTEKYDVGYAIKNLNPWVSTDFNPFTVTTETVSVDEGNFNVGDEKDPTKLGGAVFLDPERTEEKQIYPYMFSLVGNQVDWKSVMDTVYNDSGDYDKDGNPIVDENDGIFVTCTSVTYGKGTTSEKTVLFITVDAMKAYNQLVTDVRNQIVSELYDEYGITKDQIMISTNHTHSGPHLESSLGSYIDESIFDTTDKKNALKKDRANYYNWVVGRIVEAARDAVSESEPATMTRGSVDAKVATAALRYNNDNGYQMNTIRHYEVNVTNKNTAADESTKTISYISSNASVNSKMLGNAMTANGVSFTQGTAQTTTSDEADNTMYVLRFEFEKDSGKQPVVFVNWRAHSTMNSSDTVDRSALSSDYANGLRTVLKNTYECRAALFVGAAGNVVPSPKADVYTVIDKNNTKNKICDTSKMDWLAELTTETVVTNKTTQATTEKVVGRDQTFTYGKILAEIANYCMTTDGCMTGPLSAGIIKNYQYSWTADRQIYSDTMKKAALEFRGIVEDAVEYDATDTTKNWETIITQHIANHESDSTIQEKYFPYRYTDPDTKEVAILNTRLHYNSVYGQAKPGASTNPTLSGVELNAIKLGENVAFVTSPNELADYYHDFSDIVNEDGTVTKPEEFDIESYNDWNNLKKDNDTSYGMPFVLGYSNQNSGYIANWLDFHSNSDLFYQITEKGQEGHMIYSPGTYESLTSRFAQGQGEALIGKFAEILDLAESTYNVKWCDACERLVEWKQIFPDSTGISSLGSGHYYLAGDSDFVNWPQLSLKTNNEICIDLNGKNVSAVSRFAVSATGCANATLNILDSKGGATVTGNSASNNPNGGTICLTGSKNTLNIYGGTYQFNNCEYDPELKLGTSHGGIVTVSYKMNMYGGKIIGTRVHNITKRNDFEEYSGRGGAVYVGTELNIYGGEITSGEVPLNGQGPCVCAYGDNTIVNLAGGRVEDVFFRKSTEKLSISDAYNAKDLSVTFAVMPADGAVIGTAVGTPLTNSIKVIKWTESQASGDDANYADSNLTNCENAEMFVCDNKLYIAVPGDNAKAIAWSPTAAKSYSTLNDALQYDTNGYVKLIASDNASTTVSEDTYLDLNGYNANVSLDTGATLYCKDSATDDYVIEGTEDNYSGYGKLTVSGEGAVKGMPEKSEGGAPAFADDGYFMYNESNNTYSFHRVNLDLSSMTLNTGSCGIKYNSNFAGDQIVAKNVKQFGVAMSVRAVPNESNLDTHCGYSKFSEFEAGDGMNSASSTILRNIIKNGNTALINNRNANMPIYGRAYIIFENDVYMFGSSCIRTFRQQVEDISGMWDTLEPGEKIAIKNLYKQFNVLMKNWNIQEIKDACSNAS